MTEKYYQLGTHTAEQYHEIHELLCEATDGVANIPDRACTCHDDKVHGQNWSSQRVLTIFYEF